MKYDEERMLRAWQAVQDALDASQTPTLEQTRALAAEAERQTKTLIYTRQMLAELRAEQSAAWAHTPLI